MIEPGTLPGMSSTPDIHLNLNVRGLPPSSTVAINERCNELRAAGRDVIKLGLGQSPFPVPEPVVESLRQHAHEKDYLPVRGLRALRDAVAHFHLRRDGVQRTGDDVLIGPGSKELMFLLQLSFYGDLVIPTPAWVSYAPQARIIGRRVVLVDTEAQDDWRLAPERLEAMCRTDPGRPRIVIINYPANPTGGTYSPQQLQALAKVAADNKLLMLSDEIYGELHHTGDHVSLARYYPEGTIISSGLSKWCGAGGWRLGTFLFPPQMRWLLDAMAAAASETYTSTSAPIQYAAVTAFDGQPQIETYLQRSRRILAAAGRWCHAKLVAAGAHCVAPAGAFYLLPDFSPLRQTLAARGITTSLQLTERLLDETGVAILPGQDFGRDPSELTARLAYVDFDGAAALAAVAELPDEATPDEAFVRRYLPRVTDGIERMCDWVGRTG